MSNCETCYFDSLIDLTDHILNIFDEDSIAITDINLYKRYPEVFKLFGKKVIVIKDGEVHKNIPTLHSICSYLVDFNITRNGKIFAIGGGVVGDIAGFAASIYKRGIDFYQVPTSLLAMVDSSIGSKNGINLKGKNILGTFYTPKQNLVCFDFLKKLPEREFSCGMAEIIKYGFLDKNIGSLIKEKDKVNIKKVIKECIDFKNLAVSFDLYEKHGIREILNFGHTFGHAVEMLYPQFNHGESIAIGMLFDTYCLNKELTSELSRILKEYNLPTKLPNKISAEKFLDFIKNDKKNKVDSCNLIGFEKESPNAISFTFSEIKELIEGFTNEF